MSPLSATKHLILICNKKKLWQECVLRKKEESSDSSFSVPRPGLEPGWVAPLVFETSASTDSAIWAFACAKVRRFFETTRIFGKIFAKLTLFLQKDGIIGAWQGKWRQVSSRTWKKHLHRLFFPMRPPQISIAR